MKAFEWIAIVGAFAWLPHIIAIVKEHITKPKIRVITAKTAELGFSTYGPILNLRVAFSVKSKDVVISGITIRLRHESGEEKLFTWHGVVQNMLQMNNPEFGPIPFEKELSVLAIKLTLKEVEERFIRFQESAYHVEKEVYESKAVKKLTYLQQRGDVDYDIFLQSQEMKELYSFIKHSFNWKSGKYTLSFEMESPAKFILNDNEYSFELNAIDIEQIERNTDLIERVYEYEIKPLKDGEKRQKLLWAWRNPVLKLKK